MEDRDLLIEGLIQEGVEPTTEEIARLDADVDELVDILAEYVLWKRRSAAPTENEGTLTGFDEPHRIHHKTRSTHDENLSPHSMGTNGT